METNPVRDKIICSGALFYALNTKRVLLLQKSRGRNAGTWGIVGGTTKPGESPWEGLQREIVEEIGSIPDTVKSIPLEMFVSPDTVFNFHTYLCIVSEEFIPVLSAEHTGWCWAMLDKMPKPVHYGLRNSLSDRTFKSKLNTIFDVISVLLASPK